METKTEVKAEVKDEDLVVVTDEQIRERLKELLTTVDLQTTTERQIRKTLQEEFGADLSDKKAVIRGEIQAYLDEQAANDVQGKTGSGDAEPAEGDEEAGAEAEGDDEEESSDDEARPPKKRRGGGGGGSVLSEALAAFLGVPTMPRFQVVKEIWVYIKANNLQDPRNKQKIIVDEKMGTIFKAPLTMFSMNKQLSRHIGARAMKADGSDEDGSGDDDAERPPKKRAPKRKKASTGEGGGASNGFTKQLPVSEKMAAWIGKSEISRPELTSFFWKYIKDNGLQDPNDKRIVICDEALQDLTGEESFPAFGFAKYMKSHINPEAS